MLNKNELRAVIIIALIFIYYSIFMYIPAFTSAKSGAVALLWLGLTVYFIRIKSGRHACKLKDESYFYIVMAVVGVMYFITYFVLGFIDGFGYSMYDNSFRGIIYNIALLGSVIVMKEWVRDKLLSGVEKRYKVLFGVLITIAFTFTEVNLYNLASLNTFRGVVEYLCSDALPKLAINAFLTYAVYIMGYKGAVYYSIITRFPVWFFDYLPNLRWITLLILGVAFHVFCIIILNDLHRNHVARGRRRGKNTEGPYGLIITCVIIVGLAWFALGVFPVYPVSIVSNSMNPIISRGDMVLVNEVDYSDIAVGDVILYRRDNADVLHRVVEIEYVNGEKQLRTKGDANNIMDGQPIVESSYRGKHIFTIKYIGYPGIWVKQVNSDTVNEINSGY